MNFSKLVTIIFCFLIFKSYSQSSSTFKLTVTLENAPFKSLTLHDYTDDKNVFITGKHIDNFTWEFDIPDSIAINSEFLSLLSNPYDAFHKSSTSIRFIDSIGSKQLKTVNIGIEDRENYIYGKYIGETIFENEKLSPNITKLDSVITGDLILQDFILLRKENTSMDIEVRIKEPYFAWFMSFEGNNKSYTDYLNSYIDLSKSYPTSRYILMNLANNLTNFKSREDIKLIYDNLSDKHRYTKWYLMINNYLDNEFINTKMKNLKSGNYENVIESFEKLNLIIFTASWCAPCIEEIPLLKNIHEDMKESVNFTYLTIDKKSDIINFQQLVQKYKITWRSLFSEKDITSIKNLYFVSSIPHVLLVYPDKKFDVIDIRRVEDREKIYKAVLKTK